MNDTVTAASPSLWLQTRNVDDRNTPWTTSKRTFPVNIGKLTGECQDLSVRRPDRVIRVKLVWRNPLGPSPSPMHDEHRVLMIRTTAVRFKRDPISVGGPGGGSSLTCIECSSSSRMIEKPDRVLHLVIGLTAICLSRKYDRIPIRCDPRHAC